MNQSITSTIRHRHASSIQVILCLLGRASRFCIHRGGLKETQDVQERRNKKKSKGKKPALTTPSGSGGGTLVERNSGPRLESGKAKDNKASVGEAPSTVEGGRSEVVSSAVSESGAESDDALGKEF